MTADDILPLVVGLTAQERVRLIRLIAQQPAPAGGDDAKVYGAVPARTDEFSTDAEPLEWESDGWEGLD